MMPVSLPLLLNAFTGTHRRPRPRVALALVAALTMPAWVAAQSKTTAPGFDPVATRALLLKLDAEWSEVTSKNQDVDKIVSYWSDDAVVIPPGRPKVEGKTALREFVAQGMKLQGFSVHWTSDSVSFSPDGHLAYMQGTNVTTVPGADGRLTTLHGRSVTIWRHEPDGRWRCILDIWNNAPPAETPK